MNRLTSIALLLISITANAQFLNKINSEPIEGLIFGNAVLGEGTMVYQAQKDKQYSLWSFNTVTKTKEKLITFEENKRAQQITSLNGLFYFVITTGYSERRLWQTDGTQSGTKQVSNQLLGNGGLFTVVGDALLAMTEDSDMLHLQNDALINRNLSFDSIKQICAFSSEDIVVFTGNEETNNFSLKRLENDSFVDVFQVPTELVSNVNVAFFEDTCFFSYLNQTDSVNNIIKLPASGTPEVFSLDAEITHISSLLVHDGKVYVVIGPEFAPNTIYRLSDDLTTYDAELTVADNYLISFAISKNHLISIKVTQDRFEGLSLFAFLDSDLNVIPSYFNLSQFNFDTAHESGSDVVIGFNSYEAETVIQTINADNNISLLSIKNHLFRRIMSSDNNEKLYLYLTDKTTQTSNIYSLNEKPVLNDLINGAWIEPDIVSQGLVIQKGRRQDDSEYLFATFYTFDQGQPLWLAGDINLLPEQQELTLDMYSYDGLQLLEYDQSATRNIFGEMTLELENCNKIKVTISSENYNDSFPFYRVDDTSYNHLCAEINPLNLDTTKSMNTVLENGHE